jgi:hypothetical protein
MLGPELFWLLVYGVTLGLARLNLPPSEAGNAWLERLAWLLPLVAIPAAFVWTFGFMAPGLSRFWLSIRLTLACLVGLNVCLFHLADAIDYQDTRNAGVLGVWMMGFLAGLLAFAGSAIVVAVIGWKGR